ncbi:MAG: TonB-dependent receptor, partial [Candidatus Electryoneaceae bacterium]|nr:TonB-dependent receptor [Candidatus Electryoneaceae bacterium]
MKQILIIVVVVFITLLATLVSSAETTIKPGTIKGVVLDQATRSPVVNANVIIIGTEMGAATNLEGRFSVGGLPPGTYHIEATALGYIGGIKSEIAVLPARSVTVEFLLEPTAIAGDAVVVRSGLFRLKPDLVTSSRSLRFEEIRRAPGSVEDVQRAIQALPGVTSSNDQDNEIIVRGGSPSENLLVIDGVEIDNINHFAEQSTSGGPIGMVNPEFLREVTFASGGFSARYGDKLSSVLDLTLREGDRDQFSGQFELSMAGIGANFEGGIAGGRGSYLVSYRKSYLDLLKGPVGLTAVPHYYDSQFKAVYDLSPVSKLSMTGLYGRNWVSINAEDEDAWSRGAESVESLGYTLALGVKWSKVWGWGYSDVTVARTQLNFDHDVFELEGNLSRRIFRNISTETTDQLHINWTGRVGKTDELSAGISLKPITFSHDMWFEQDTTVYDFNDDGIADTTHIQPEWNVEESLTSLKYGGFIQYRWRPHNNLALVSGVRLDGFQYAKQTTISPRLSFSWDFLPQWTFKLAYGIYRQSHP